MKKLILVPLLISYFGLSTLALAEATPSDQSPRVTVTIDPSAPNVESSEAQMTSPVMSVTCPEGTSPTMTQKMGDDSYSITCEELP